MAKYKLKPHKGTVKRVKLTKKGKLKVSKASQGHKLEKKPSSKKGTFHKLRNVSKSDIKRIRILIGK
ncbi:50S ribosomal protein L35 [Patescibacteria group bacterium]|nr:50S ribosomal protein L35 [Patescibacteria group bacterium]